MYSAWRQLATSYNRIRLIIFAAAFIVAVLLPMLSSPGTARADNVVLAGSSWLNGGGVDVMSGGNGTHNCVQVAGAPGGSGCSSGSVYSGDKWQCVEMVNRLYLTKGWTNTTLWGNGNTIVNDIPNHPGLVKQSNGAISYVNAGDIITLDNGGLGHAAIIDNGTTTVNIINQNATLNSTATIASGSLSAGNASYNSSWFGYSVQAIIHHSPLPRDIAWFQTSNHLLTFQAPNLNTTGDTTWSPGAWNAIGHHDFADPGDDLFFYDSANHNIDWMSSNGTRLGANGVGTMFTNVPAPSYSLLGDFDGDGLRNDIAWWVGNTIYTYIGRTGSVTSVSGYNPPTWGGVGRYDHNSNKDNLFLYDGPTDQLLWMSSNGTTVGANGIGTIRTGIGGAPSKAYVGDFAGTGHRDSIAYFRGSTLFLLKGSTLKENGSTTYTAPYWGGVVNFNYGTDNYDDLYLYNDSTSTIYWMSSNGQTLGSGGIAAIRTNVRVPNWAGVGHFEF